MEYSLNLQIKTLGTPVDSCTKNCGIMYINLWTSVYTSVDFVRKSINSFT